MTPEQMDKIFADAANCPVPPTEPPDLVQRVQAAGLKDLRPVRPLPAPWVLTLVFGAVFFVFAGVSALILGLNGLHALGQDQRAAIFTAVALGAWLAALAAVREMRPAGGRRLSSIAFATAAVAFPILFFLLFHGYTSQNLIREGIPCLVAGLCVSIPAAFVTAWVLRAGCVLSWRAAGVAAGTLCGLAGLGMLELHCPNLKAIHVLLWHVTVVLVSAALGFGAGWFADLRGATRPEDLGRFALGD